MSQFIIQCSEVWNLSQNPPVCTGTQSQLDMSQITSGLDSTDFEYLSSAILTIFLIAYGFRVVKKQFNVI